MKVTWKVEGAAGWNKTIEEDISLPPMEIATKVIESITPKDSCELGLVLMVTHDQMESIDETFICHVPTVLANAGFYREADQLQNMIDKLVK
jgi:hypothetical protein